MCTASRHGGDLKRQQIYLYPAVQRVQYSSYYIIPSSSFGPLSSSGIQPNEYICTCLCYVSYGLQMNTEDKTVHTCGGGLCLYHDGWICLIFAATCLTSAEHAVLYGQTFFSMQHEVRSYCVLTVVFHRRANEKHSFCLLGSFSHKGIQALVGWY